tara:strand:- start:51 stop:641 length:591 start_codon:yes stop_codon:yes gene_type:complete
MIKLIDILKELYDKNLIGPEYGEGGQHIVYKYGSDKIIKFSHYGKIGDNVKIFTKYPDIFPKVYDIGPDYAILEKLDDNKAYKEMWESIKSLFSTSSEIPPKNEYIAKLVQMPRIKGPNWYNSEMSQLMYNNLDDNELKSQLQKELPSNLYNSLIKNWYPLLQKVKNISWNLKIKKDINDENFGYTPEGKLKMLDI